jgi:signal transduction histidine kinase
MVFKTAEDDPMRQKISNIKMTKRVWDIVYDVLDSSLNSVLITDTQNRIMYMNSSFLKTFEVEDSSQFMNRDAADLFSEETFKSLRDISDFINTSGKETIHLVLKTGKGRSMLLETTVADVVDIDNRITGTMASFIDVTELFHLQGVLEDARKRIQELSLKLVTVEENQKKICAQELHDGVGSNLAAIKFAIESRKDLFKQEGSNSDEVTFEQLVSIVRQTIEEIQRICKHLRPQILENRGLITALNYLIEDLNAIYKNVEIDFSFDIDEEDIPEDLKIVIFRVAQEIINNGIQHAKAGKINLSLVNAGETIALSASDDGAGFDLAALKNSISSGKGLGIINIEERTRLFGGDMKIYSEKGKGTVVKAWWPR